MQNVMATTMMMVMMIMGHVWHSTRALYSVGLCGWIIRLVTCSKLFKHDAANRSVISSAEFSRALGWLQYQARDIAS